MTTIMDKTLNPKEYIEVVEQIKAAIADYDARNAINTRPHAQGSNAIAAFDIVQSLIQANDALTVPKPSKQSAEPEAERPEEVRRAARRAAVAASAALDEETQRPTVQVFNGLPRPAPLT